MKVKLRREQYLKYVKIAIYLNHTEYGDVLMSEKQNYFFHCKKCDNDWFII